MVALATQPLTEKILAGERISSGEALELYRWPLPELGALAECAGAIRRSEAATRAAARKS